ncbi:response regulator [Paenibacillus nasutitermitis]|uniref:Response regulatory domain-containing protein n=1 Tax=Paenibacillus nasutitermitis TaxID=1652958 RepID=A0A916ZD19_9BACL|nr:response regulator [Paenibacillus nasutitermitis]GGD89091.1 hypothetical protein GCM10010911_54610 [Paenibacillus nasutitermitis]
MIETILVDDEEMALEALENRLLEIGGVSVIGKFQQVSEALAEASSLRPGLIFLDIEMPGVNGLAAAETFKSSCPGAEIVFVTAHAQYAIDAFDRQALGYLLKPVNKERLIKALERYVGLQARKENTHSIPDEADQVQRKGSRAAGDRLRLQILGSLELYTADGRLLTWRTKKTKELFAYLWHHRGQPIYRYHILDHLWPDHLPERAQGLLHTSLYYLRSMLKLAGFPDMVTFGDERYWMQVDGLASDMERLEELMEDPSVHTGEAVLLYRGDYLDREHYDWAVPRRYEFRSRFLRYLDRALEKADGSEQEPLLRKRVELEPDKVEYYDQWIAFLEQMGDKESVKRVQAMKADAEEQAHVRGEINS